MKKDIGKKNRPRQRKEENEKFIFESQNMCLAKVVLATNSKIEFQNVKLTTLSLVRPHSNG